MKSISASHPWFHADRHPDKPAIVMADSGEQYTYAQMTERSNRVTRYVRDLGLRPGDTLAIVMENRPDFLVLCWAAKNAGYYYVGVSTHLTPTEAAFIVEHSGSRLLIGSAATRHIIEGIRAIIGDRCTYTLLDAEADQMSCLNSAMEGIPGTRPEATRRGASMLYSSGTTGRPKGVKVPLLDEPPEMPPLRHGMLVNAFGFDSSTVFIDPGPLYHAGPLRFAMAVQREGGTVVLMRRFDSMVTLRAIDSFQVTHGLFVPTMFVRMLRERLTAGREYSHASLRAAIHGAAPCPIPIKEQMLEWWGPVIYELYGGTEGSGTTVIDSREWLAHRGSVGKPLPGITAHIVDDAGNELPANTPGRVFFNSPRRFEYHDDPQSTEAARHPNGWTTMGDIGHLDTEGFLYLTDRESDMIISGGVNIYPREAENVLQAHPEVADVAVIGVPNAEYGEEVRAIVQPEAGVLPSPQLAQRLLAFCRGRLSPIKCPRAVDFVDRLPRQENGKLYKRLLRERYGTGHDVTII